MQNVLCPHCGKQVELTEAFRHEVEEKIGAELKESQKAEFEKVRKETLELAEKKFRDETSVKEKNLINQIEQLKKDKTVAEEKELELLKKERDIDDKSRKLELELQRKLNEEIEKVRMEGDQKSKMEKLELEKKLSDTQKALEDAQRKTRQGSQQLQGEVLELDLEAQLALLFPEDEILPVPKGISGADLIQKVRNKVGKTAGVIIWEAKRAKWSDSWVQKLKDDMIAAKANEAILVVEELPDKITHSGFLNGVWVTSYKDAVTLANSVRVLLKKIAQTKASEENKDEKLEDLYQFITSDNFKHRVASHVETIISMKTGLDSDRRLQERVWKRREVEISRLDRISGIFDEMAAIAGTELPLPQKSQELEDSEELKLIE